MHSLDLKTQYVNGFTISPDKRKILWSEKFKTIKMANTSLDSVEKLEFNNLGPVTVVGFSPNGEYLFTGDRKGFLKVWNFTTKELIASIRGHKKRIFYIAISPDGKKIVTRAWREKPIKVWGFDSKTLIHIRDIRQKNIYIIFCISQDGKYYANSSIKHQIKIGEL